MKLISTTSDFSMDQQAHLTLVEFVSVVVPSNTDDRNGGSVPTKKETYARVYTFDSEADLQRWLVEHGPTARYIVLSAQRVGVKLHAELVY